jgi:hypothetical protein
MRRLLFAAAVAACTIFAGGANAVTTNGFPDGRVLRRLGRPDVPGRRPERRQRGARGHYDRRHSVLLDEPASRTDTPSARAFLSRFGL